MNDVRSRSTCHARQHPPLETLASQYNPAPNLVTGGRFLRAAKRPTDVLGADHSTQTFSIYAVDVSLNVGHPSSVITTVRCSMEPGSAYDALVADPTSSVTRGHVSIICKACIETRSTACGPSRLTHRWWRVEP